MSSDWWQTTAFMRAILPEPATWKARTAQTGAMRISAAPRLCLVALATLLSLTLLSPVPAHALPSEDTWREDVAEAMAGSRRFLERRAENGGRLAINLDIDNTALATEYDTGHATRRVLRFARKAHRLDIAVFFNTARPRSDVRRTARVLRRAGYTVDDICGRKSRRVEGPQQEALPARVPRRRLPADRQRRQQPDRLPRRRVRPGLPAAELRRPPQLTHLPADPADLG